MRRDRDARDRRAVTDTDVSHVTFVVQPQLTHDHTQRPTTDGTRSPGQRFGRVESGHGSNPLFDPVLSFNMCVYRVFVSTEYVYSKSTDSDDLLIL